MTNLPVVRRSPQLPNFPLFQAASDREFKVLSLAARWLVRRHNLTPAVAIVVAEQLFAEDRR